MVKLIGILSISLLIASCEARYRYPCQNPTNWEEEFCKAPQCEVNRDCPKYIFKDEKICKKE